MARKFAHLLPQDAEVWERFLSTFGGLFHSFEYDVRVGLGTDPGPDFDQKIRDMALDLSMRRIDVVAHTPDLITVIEVTKAAGFKALGQLYGYPILYTLTFHPIKQVRSVLVCETIQTDMRPVLDTLGIMYHLV